MTTLTAIDSEGARSARRICKEVPEARGPMAGDPYLLSATRTDSASKAPPKLRLIRLADTAPVCGRGTCAVSPECTRECRYREADRALRGHYSSRHTQRLALPGERPTDGPSDENGPIEYVSKWHERVILGALLAVFIGAATLPFIVYALQR